MPPDSSKKRSNMTVSRRGQAAERRAAGRQILHDLQRRGFVEADGVDAATAIAAPGSTEAPLDLRSAARETAADSSSVRPGASPSQNGMDGGCPCASSTRTVPRSTRKIRYDVLPSWKISPCRLSTAKSSLTVPTTMTFRLEHDLVIGIVRNGAAGGDAPSAARPCAGAACLLTAVVMQERAVAPAPRAESFARACATHSSNSARAQIRGRDRRRA